MCGINGFNWPDRDLIERMNHITRHRGPDDHGVYVDEAVSLGHRRLSIIDLSSAGHQPMPNEDETLWCLHNGEIYNFRQLREDLLAAGHTFRSHTDTEVILHAYESHGAACLDRFNGMWAFALYDRTARLLLLARDRFGIKPLYYHVADGRLIFSSMIAAVMIHAIGAAPNDRAIMEYLAFNLEQHTDRTFVRGVQSLLPGHLLTYDLRTGRHRVRRWYRPRPCNRTDTEALRAAFTESVHRRTVSDVPIGVCLSGGIDSSAITCTLDAYLPEPFDTYSLVVPGSPIDESRHIEEVARHTRIRTRFTTVDVAEFLRDVDDFVECMEEPVTGLSGYAQYRVFQLAHRHGAKVLLDGQGGDEILAGYVYYFGYRFWELFAGLQWHALAGEMLASYRKLGDLFPHALFAFLVAPEWVRRPAWRRLVTPWVNHAFLQEVCDGDVDPRWRRMTTRQSLTQTLFSTSIPHNLMWEDKSSMRWSIESRVPFLDVDFVEAAMSLRTEQLLKDGKTKVIFKRAMDRLLPEKIRNRTDKVGFDAPVDTFFQDPQMARFARDIVYSPSFCGRPYWHAARVHQMYESHLGGKTNAGDTIWKCVNLELWLRRFFPSARTDPKPEPTLSSADPTGAGTAIR